MDIKEGVCTVCKMPILVNTVDVNGRVQLFCESCKDMLRERARKALIDAGKDPEMVKRMDFVFPSADAAA